MHQIDHIKQLLDQLTPYSNYKIGIGITTHNRPDMLAKCIDAFNKFIPSNCTLVIVDDASTKPVLNANFRFETNAGIAKAKNKCLELLYKSGCEHFFLFDDDCWPKHKDWYLPYVNSSEPHLMYIFKDFSSGIKLNDNSIIYSDKKHIAYSHERGCMLYYKKICLETVGGMYEGFQKWGFEHGDLSNRIFMSGLTSFRFMDVVNSSELIYSHDEHNNNSGSTVVGKDRQLAVSANKPIYDSRKFSKVYEPFYKKENIFLTCYFANIKDTQRLQSFSKTSDQLQALIKSLKETRLIVLHDCLTDENTDKVEFVKVDTSINPYFQRWISYREYLMQNRHLYANVFCIDGTDVEILKDPDWDNIKDFIFTGDELEKLDNDSGWMRNNHKNSEIQAFLKEFGEKYQLLNAGVLGGSIDNVIEFTRAINDFYLLSDMSGDTTDMGAFNYIARTVFNEKLKYGREITTDFKSNTKNNYSWIKHK